MALEYVNKSTFSGAGSATLTGINSTDTYIVHWKNIQISNNNTNVVIQFTVSGSPQTSAVYNYYQQRMGAWSENKGQNQNYINMTQFGGTGTYSYPAMEGFLTLYSFNTNNVQSFRPNPGMDVANGTLPEGNVGMDQIMNLMNSK